MLTKLHLASGNPHKAAEFQALARATGLAVEIVSAHAVGGMPPVVEDAGTFVGNARKKARALLGKISQDRARLQPALSRGELPKDVAAGTKASQHFNGWVLADDSGLCVDALSGAPGVDSAYYAGPAGDAAANLRKLVDAMRDVPSDERSAHFVCVLVLLDSNGVEHVFEGRCEGRLLDTPRDGAGFGYDPLFVPNGRTESFAEMLESEKNQLSHRANAWGQLAGFLRNNRLPGLPHCPPRRAGSAT